MRMSIPRAPQTNRARPHAEPGVDEPTVPTSYDPIELFCLER
jgi:hypothetical protein